VLFAGAAMMMVVPSAFCQQITSIANGNWNTNSTWNTGSEPTTTNIVLITANNQVEITDVGEVSSNLLVSGGTTSTLTMTSGDLTAFGTMVVNQNGTFIINNGAFLAKRSGIGSINYVGNANKGTLIINGGTVDLTPGTFRTSQNPSTSVSNRAHIEIHNTGHLIVDGNALFSVRGDTSFIMDGGEFDGVGIQMAGFYNLGQITFWTQSGGQFDLTGGWTVRPGSGGTVHFTMEGGYGTGTNFNVGILRLHGHDGDTAANGGRESRFTALLDAGGIEPINVKNAVVSNDTALTNMELGIGILGGATLGDVLGVHDFIISTGPIDTTDLVLVVLPGLTNMGGSASYQIVTNSLGGETLQLNVIGGPDLRLTKTVVPTNLLTGITNLTYTINVMNLSTVGISGVVVTDSIPANVILLSSIPPPSQTNGNDYIFNLGFLSNGAITTIVINAAVTSVVPGTLTNWAIVSTTNVELNLANNRDSAETTIFPPPPLDHDLALTKTASSSNLLFGTNLTYVINIMNLSTSQVGGVVVTDSIPVAVTVLWSIPPATLTNGNDYIFNLGLLGAGASTSITIYTTITSSVPGVVTNWAQVTTTNSELLLSNNFDSAVTVIPDSDNDGIANPADPDDDNDNFPDTSEYIANTDSLDSNSFLWVRIMRSGTTDIQRLMFPASTGRTYRIQGATNLTTAPWLDVRTNIPGTNGFLVIPDTNGLNRMYYRIGVESP